MNQVMIKEKVRMTGKWKEKIECISMVALREIRLTEAFSCKKNLQEKERLVS